MPIVQRPTPDVVLEAGRREPTEEEYRRKVYQTYGMPGALAYMREGELSYETQQRLWQERQRRREVQMRRDYPKYRLLGALTMMHQEAPLSMEQKEAISTYYTEYKAYKQRIATGELLLGSKIQQIAYEAGGEPGLQVFGELQPHVYYGISEWQVIWGAKLGERLSKPRIATSPKEPTVKPPPKDWGEWLGRGWEGLVGFSQKRVKEAYEPRFAEVVLYGPKFESRTQTAIFQIESFQQWIREAPAPEVMMLKKGRITYGKPTERYAELLEYAYIPVGMVKAVETAPYAVGALAIGATAIPPALLKGQVTPENIVKGAKDFVSNIRKQPLILITTYEPQVALKHKGLIIGELTGQYFLARYVYGPAIGKAWQKMKGGVRWVYEKTPFYERALYKKATTLPSTPTEEPFKVLTKTKTGWEYKPLTVFEETAKKTWKPTVITKAKGFKPIEKAWYPPEPMKATALRKLPKEFVVPASKGMALITKQVTTQMTKQIAKTTKISKLVLPTVAVSLLAPKTVPSLVKYKGPEFPSKYKQKKDILLLLAPKLAPYPTTRKKAKLRPVPELLWRSKEIEREIQLPKQPQLPKQAELLKHPQLLAQKQLLQQTQTVRQVQRQIQKETFKPSRKAEDLFGRWFERVHPIKTPREMLATFGLAKSRRRKRR